MLSLKKLVLAGFILLLPMTEALANPDYLAQPKGHYGVGFQDLHWVDNSRCPDFNYTGKNGQDFSAKNVKHCHEIVVRAYYPTLEKSESWAPYYSPFVQAMQSRFTLLYPDMPKDQIQDFGKLQSFSIEKAPLAKDSQFPVLLFSPGFGLPAQVYENFITELVSRGYIVLGINSPFINPVALPNGHIVMSASGSGDEFYELIEKKYVPLQAEDLTFVYKKIKELHTSNELFSAMTLDHVGVFGHSLGARVLADVSHAHPTWFQAAVALDIGFDTTGESLKSFSIPFMYQIGAGRRWVSTANPPLKFELGEDGYLVVLSPNEKDHHYSSHISFSDFSTLQYTPAFQTELEFLHNKAYEGFTLRFMQHEPTEDEIEAFDPTEYVLFKTEETWHLGLYLSQKEESIFDIRFVEGLEEALAALPEKNPEDLSETEIAPINNILTTFHRVSVYPVGTGDGWEITQSINTNLMQFFDTYLKTIESQSLKNCTALTSGTHMYCGKGEA